MQYGNLRIVSFTKKGADRTWAFVLWQGNLNGSERSAYTNIIEELRLKKDIESARCLIESGDFNSGRRLLEKSSKLATKTLKGYQQNIARLLEECWKSEVILVTEKK